MNIYLAPTMAIEFKSCKGFNRYNIKACAHKELKSRKNFTTVQSNKRDVESHESSLPAHLPSLPEGPKGYIENANLHIYTHTHTPLLHFNSAPFHSG